MRILLIACGVLLLDVVHPCVAASKQTEKNESQGQTPSQLSIDVIVEDHDGNFVSGLTRDDFALSVGKDELKIVDFAMNPSSAGAAASSAPGAVGPGRRFILVVDLLNSEPQPIERLKPDLLKFVRETISSEDPMLIATVTPEFKLQILNRFTSAREVLTKSIESLHTPGPPTTKEVRDGWHAFVGYSLNALGSLVQAVESNQWWSGRKIILYCTPAFPRGGMTLQALRDFTIGRLNQSRGTLYSLSMLMVGRFAADSTRFGPDYVTSSGQLSQGSVRQDPGSPYLDPSQERSQSHLTPLAEGTGGIAFIAQPSWMGSLQEIERDTRMSYFLAIEPKASSKGKGEKGSVIEIRCKRPGTRVRPAKIALN